MRHAVQKKTLAWLLGGALIALHAAVLIVGATAAKVITIYLVRRFTGIT